MTNVNQTASDNAEEFGFHAGDLVQEWLWDDDVDDSIRAKIEELTGEELVDEDYDSAVDGVIIWWRDGDDEDELADTIVDAYAVLGDDGPLWVLTPKPGRPGAASSSTVQSAAKTAGMNAATPLTVSSDWNGIHLRAFVDITRDDMRFLDFSRRCEKWAMRDSNPRHPPCKGGALTN